MKNGILILLFLSSQLVLGQSFSINTFEDLRFIGYKKDVPIFKNEKKILFKLNEGSKLELSLIDSGKLESFSKKFVGAVEYYNNQIRYVETFAIPFKIYLQTEQNIFTEEVNLDPGSISTDFESNTVYISKKNSDANLHLSFPIQALNMENGKINKLPISGVKLNVIGDYIYYSDFSEPKQFDLVYDIYKVKIGDWDNPIKLFTNNYMNGWKISTDGKYLLVEMIETGSKPQKVIYDIGAEKYIPIDLKSFPRAVFYSKKKNAFCFYDIEPEGGERRFVYIDMPTDFPYTPNWAMNFGASFINNYLIDEASEDELKHLDKSQLRLLRNAIFARKGWRFKDEVLTAFFNQFEWYSIQIEKYADNSEIKLTNNDKYRANLIQKMEQNK